MNYRRHGVGIICLLLLAFAGYRVATFALPMDKVFFDKWSTGLGPRLWLTWLLLGTYVLAALSFGQLVVRRVSRAPRDGTWALAFSSGTIVFAAAIGLFGWMGWLGYPFFWLLPLGMTLVGLPSLRDAVVESRARWQLQPAFSAVEMLALLFGGVCLGLLLLQVIAPDNVNFDAMWYHLRSAERNALAGAILRTPEGDMLLSLPSATSWLYTWAFLAPGVVIEDRVVLALHLEFAVFVGTLAYLPALVRALVPLQQRRATRVAWVALFFFPSVFVYDTGLMGGADHMVALWSAAAVLAWLQARERDDAASWALVGLQLAGLSAKYSSLYLLVPLIPVMLIDALMRRKRAKKSASPFVLSGLMVAAGIALLITVPYWLRNWVWYHNPVYPAASWLFPSIPWNPDAAASQAYYALSNVFTASTSSPSYRVESTLMALLNYQRQIYGWKDMMGDQSVMGSGYLLSLVVLPFLPERRRLLILAVLINVGIIVWFNTHQHHMRYLTVLTPLMAAGMAATALSLWDLGLPSRLAVVGLTALLLSAYADVPFRQTHRIWRHSSPVENAADFIAKRGPGGVRLKMWDEVGSALPPGAKPLVHGVETHLGLQRQTVTDCSGLQFGINYGRWGSVAEVWRHLRQMGVTHLIWSGDVEQADSISGEALLMGLARATVNQQVVRNLHLGELPSTAPPAEPGTHMLYVGCTEHWRTGIYPLATLAEPLPPSDFIWRPLEPYEPVKQEEWLSRTSDDRLGWVVMEESCKLPQPQGYSNMGTALQPSKVRYFVRQR